MVMVDHSVPSVMHVPLFGGESRVTYGEKQVPVPSSGELLIAVKANALCGSERGQFARGSQVTPGHEATGVVVAVGPDTQIPLGTPGAVFLMDFCGACRSCRLGLTNQCLNKRGDMGFNKDGGYGQYELVHESIFFPIDADIPLTEATMLLDVMGTSSHAIKRAQRLHPDIQSVIITGAGPVGLGLLAMAKLLLGQDIPVLIADMVSYRLGLAESLGGTPIDLRATTLQQGAAQHVSGGVDLAVDASGKGAARRGAVDALAKRGVLVCVGHGEDLSLSISADLIAPERAILGSEYFCFNELPELLPILRDNRAYLSQIITHRYPVDRLQEAFQVFFGGETGKVVIEQ